MSVAIRTKPRRGRPAASRVIMNVILVAFALASVVPVIWLILAPSKTAAELNNLPPFSFGSFSNYALAWRHLQSLQSSIIVRWAINSVWYTAAIVVISTLTSMLAGYALAATRLPLRRTFIMATLIMMLIPAFALVLPLFIQVTDLGLFDTPWSVILTSSLYPFGTFLAYIYYSTTIPTELYEAARIDGCDDWGVYFRVALPLSRGLIGLLAFFSFTGAWTNYFLPYVLLGSNSNFTLPVGLGVIFSSTPAINPAMGATDLPIGRPEVALAGLMICIPILVVFLFSQRLLTRGLLAGAVKS